MQAAATKSAGTTARSFISDQAGVATFDFRLVDAADRVASNFKKPVRTIYRHLRCGAETKLQRPVAETFACEPTHNAKTFCQMCRRYFAIGDFVWAGTKESIGQMTASI